MATTVGVGVANTTEGEGVAIATGVGIGVMTTTRLGETLGVGVAIVIGVAVGVATSTGLGVILGAEVAIASDGVAEPIGGGVAIATEGAGVTFEGAPGPRKRITPAIPSAMIKAPAAIVPISTLRFGGGAGRTGSPAGVAGGGRCWLAGRLAAAMLPLNSVHNSWQFRYLDSPEMHACRKISLLA